jgi:hypothetical protein
MADEVKVTASGPLFDGRAVTQLSVFLDEAVDLVAAAAEEAVNRNLATSIRHPTGYYQSQIQTVHHGLDRVINDNGVIYGPWLEGVGSRNKTTRFKGYASFRRAQQQIEHAVPALVAPALGHFIEAVSR